jgi:hypothetical protein
MLFMLDAIKRWLKNKSVETLYIEKGQENGFIESFNGRFRDEVLNCDLFYSVKETKVVAESWRMEYNTIIRTVDWITELLLNSQPNVLLRPRLRLVLSNTRRKRWITL